MVVLLGKFKMLMIILRYHFFMIIVVRSQERNIYLMMMGNTVMPHDCTGGDKY